MYGNINFYVFGLPRVRAHVREGACVVHDTYLSLVLVREPC